MPLLFSQLCDLLSALEHLSKRDPPLLQSRFHQRANDTIKTWFTSRRVSINSADIDVVALLSALFPAKRTDRVYLIQPPRLSRCLRRWLCLGKSRWLLLEQWQEPGRGDLGDCVERVLQQAELPLPHHRDRVTLEQVDTALATVAAQCRFSGPKVRAQGVEEVSTALENVYRRLQSRDAKWFTRLILKEFSCIHLPEKLIYVCIDPRLRVAMQMYDDFESAVSELRNLPASQMVDVTKGGFTQQVANDAHLLPPKIGVKLGPPKWVKAKGGVKHAISIIDGQTMSVQRKHDGEYCQIHVDLSKGEDCIQIFSKSGKDSTEDRRGVHQAIKDGLRIGRDNCRFVEKCILEGELLVYSDQTESVLEFHKIRKHVSRSGSFLGTILDSQPHPWEHLMMMFHDVMLIDDDLVLHQPYGERRSRLERLVKRIPGRSDCTWQDRVRFSKPEPLSRLKNSLALAFARRWEGLVLKPWDDPYFNLGTSTGEKPSSRWIKLKKDCIRGLGDTADFAVIGGGYDAGQAAKFPGLKMEWTHFFIGSMQNKEAVLHRGAKPQFFVFDVVSDCIKRGDMKKLNEFGYIRRIDPSSDEASEVYKLDYAVGVSRPKDVFRSPFVFDLAGSGFDKAPNSKIFTLRFPRVLRIHWERDWRETVGLTELQEMAATARTVPPKEALSKEHGEWVEKLDLVERGSNGLLDPWDNSDCEDGFESRAEVSVAQDVRPSRRPQGSTAPPLIRMDTSEMNDREERLCNGDVVERPRSKRPMDSVTSDCSLQTPPPPSSVGTKKRSANSADLEQTSRGFKRVCPDLQPQKKIRSNISTKSRTATENKSPLREIENSAHLSTPGQATVNSRLERSPTANLAFVRKLPADVEISTPPRHPKRRKIEETPSSVNETPHNDSNSTTLSQRSALRMAFAERTDGSPKPKPNTPSLPTPPSTANQPPLIRLPNFRECKVVLSPCFIKNQQPVEPIKGLLDRLSITPASFRQAWERPGSNLTIHDTPEPTVQLILLVESYDGEKTTECIERLVKNVPGWHPVTLAVWDWRVLEFMDEGRGVMDQEQVGKAVEGYYLAALRWDEQWEGKGAVEISWRDGEVVKVTREEAEEMGR